MLRAILLMLVLGIPAFSPARQPPSTPLPHTEQNPVYKSLLETGLNVGENLHVKFPAPNMPDGLDADKQKAVIQGLIGNDYSFQEYTRRSVVAPQLLKLRDLTPADPKAPPRGVDVWFIAYGDLKSLDDEKFLDRIMNAGRGEGKAKSLSAEDLSKRRIGLLDKNREGYIFVEFDFLEKVHLRATGHGFWSRTDDSVVVAGEIDPRFRGDPEFPNQWQSISKESGNVKMGPANPWSGAGMYLKITRLREPAGALFIEEHIIFAEPTGWFDGANLLRSKLPIAVQNNVRNIRREWVKATGK
jgi:hypothetical protein